MSSNTLEICHLRLWGKNKVNTLCYFKSLDKLWNYLRCFLPYIQKISIQIHLNKKDIYFLLFLVIHGESRYDKEQFNGVFENSGFFPLWLNSAILDPKNGSQGTSRALCDHWTLCSLIASTRRKMESISLFLQFDWANLSQRLILEPK